ncbi:hypothetical protein BS297_28185 [Rhodococcus erythropolis]|uniref:Uncharacterized protein n=1 Tax=Rhodococcus erythropolis TaxID=1833 RepID=A0A0C3A8K3_RHOER|nr:hypothetical protein BS297_28185 [Rhodococcus erythropolis]KIM15701.1 mucin [Rhodococcus erythropolis]
MKDRTVMIGAVAVAALSLTSGLVFGGAAGAFGSGGPVVKPPALVSSVSVESVAGIEPAAFYSSVAVPTVVIPPTPTWRIADETTAPRNQPLVVTATSTSSATTATSTTTPVSSTTTASATATSSPTATATTTKSSTTPVVTTGSTPPVVEVSPVLAG